MPPYDSDSDEDDLPQDVTETNVLLGYTQEDDDDAAADPDAADQPDTVSRLGGRPDWLTEDGDDSSSAVVHPPPALVRCGACGALMVLLLQLDGALPARFPGHVRRLYVFACRRAACRRRPGCIRAVRGVRVEARPEADKPEADKPADKPAEQPAEQPAAPAPPRLGDTLFGAKPFSSSPAANPFGGNPFGGGSTGANPFQLGGSAPAAPSAATAAPSAAPAPAPTTPAPTPSVAPDDLPKTFAAALSLGTAKEAVAPPVAGPPEPWPPAADWPAPYPVRWITDAEYETLEPTPAPAAPEPTMDVDEGSGSTSAKEDKYVFESSMDAAFQAFADRVAQNPEQVLRYEFGGPPLLYSRTDAVAEAVQQGRVPACGRCGAARAFEAQLMPHAIARLEADEPGLDGMDWGTVVVAVCGRDCGAGVAYAEEWAGVQWER